MRFTIDTTAAIAPNALDREIMKRAALLLASDAVWNRKDGHRRPALELVRAVVEERARDRAYNHLLMD